MKQSVEVTIAGQRYLLKSDGDRQHLLDLVAYLNRKLEELRAVARNLSPERLAILAALNITEELLREREEGRALRAEVRRRSGAMLETLRRLAAAEAAPPSDLAQGERWSETG